MSRMKIALPEEISREMKMWRIGFGGMPQSYVNFHKDLANEDLTYFEKHGVMIHKTWIASDGWGDGMKTTWSIVEYRNKLYKLSWNDGSQCFFEHSEHGGSFNANLYNLFEMEDAFGKKEDEGKVS